MTDQIFESDLELAKKLLAQHREEPEIIAALVRRRIQPAAAAQLLADLRSGKTVTPQAPVTAPRANPAAGALPEPADAWPSSSSGQSKHRTARRRRSASRSSPAIPPALLWTAMGAVLVLSIVAVGVALSRHRSSSLPAEAPGPQSAAQTAGASTMDPPSPSPDPSGANGEPRSPVTSDRIVLNPALKSSSIGLVVELQPAGLSVAGQLITSQNAFSTFAQILGGPTRTNYLQQTDRLIYAFDKHGLLVYAQPGSGGDYVVLDFEALGGTNGTSMPFLGTFKLEQTSLHADTDYKTLAALNSLGLTNPASGAGILGCDYHDLRLYFAYLRSPEHLSMVEIDLK